MKFITGTPGELEKIRSDVEAVLGYPRTPDVIGENVKNPQPTVHAWGIEEHESGAFRMTVDHALETSVSDARISKATKTKLAAMLKAKIEVKNDI